MTDRTASELTIPGGGPVSAVPAELRALPIWVGWRSVVKDRISGKRTKVPISPVTRKGADSTDPATWGTFEAAFALIEYENCDGVSAALVPPYVGIDLDDVIDPDTGDIDPDAAETIQRFGSYWELSPSRTGVHIWVKGTLAHLVGRKRGDRECYDGKRFLTVTGLAGGEPVVEERQAVLDAWHAEVFPARPSPHSYTGPTRSLDLSDSQILAKIANSKQSVKFAKLWAGNTDDYKSSSEADLALCSMLAFWCRKEPSAVDRLFRSSGLMRPKWDARRGQTTYGGQTIEKAIATGGSYDPDYTRHSANGNGKHVPGADYYTDYSAPAAGGSEPPNPSPKGEGVSLPANPGATAPLPLTLFRDVTPALDAADFVEGLLIAGTMSVIYGESNCGKTFFALDLALHVAGGLPWRGRAVERTGVLYLALEGSYGIRNRIEAFKKDRPDLSDLPFAFVPVSLSLLGPESDAVRVIEAARDAASRLLVPVGLVVVDTLSRAMGGGNENSPEDMGEFVRNVDVIRQALPAHTVVIHHSGKDVARGARGHSSLRAATDTEIEVTHDAGTKTSVARVTKQRDLELGAEFPFRLERVYLGDDRRGRPVHSCVVREAVPQPRPVLAPNGARGPSRDALRAEQLRLDEQAVLTAIDAEIATGKAGAHMRRVRELTSFSHDRASMAIARLVGTGVIVEIKLSVSSGGTKPRETDGWTRST